LPNAPTVDLVLLTACANDVGFQHFLNPTASQTSIAIRVSQRCLGDMTGFLHAAANQFPAAKIIVAGYYQGLSLDTDPAYFVNLAGVLYGLEGNQSLGPKALAAAVGITPSGRLNVVSNAGYFASQANIRLAQAVQAANVPLMPHRIFFAPPGFGSTNAANASNAWVFGLSGGVIPGPTDSSASLSRRESQCGAVYNTSSFDYMFRRLASTGHPNETGAAQYFNAIKPLL
jgi:lysophospholipase L1-like esterase